MRTRTIILIVGIVLLAAFAVLNVDEFTRSSLLSLGFTTIQLPLGLLMLVLLIVSLLIFLGTTLYIQSINMLETRQHVRELSGQRELANKAEASRFTELKIYMEAQAHAALQREAAHGTVLTERLAQTQIVLLNRLEQSDNATAAYMGQLEDRLEQRSVLPRITNQ